MSGLKMRGAAAISLAALLLTATLSLVGCGKTPPKLTPVSGVVTLRGKPLPHARVQFIPLIEGFGGEYLAEGVTDDQGKFSVKCTVGEGAAAVNSAIVIFEGPVPDEARGSSGEAQQAATDFLNSLVNRPIPQKFATAATTSLSVTVAPTQATYDIDLDTEKVTAK